MQMERVQMYYDMENLELTYPQGKDEEVYKNEKDKEVYRKGLASRINRALKTINPKYELQGITICGNKKVCKEKILNDIRDGASLVDVQVTHIDVPLRKLGRCDECDTRLGDEPDDPYERKEVANRRLIEKMMIHALDHPGACILLVSSDRDFISSINSLVLDGYQIFVASATGKEQLAFASNFSFSWEDLQHGKGGNYCIRQKCRKVPPQLKRR